MTWRWRASPTGIRTQYHPVNGGTMLPTELTRVATWVCCLDVSHVMLSSFYKDACSNMLHSPGAPGNLVRNSSEGKCAQDTQDPLVLGCSAPGPSYSLLFAYHHICNHCPDWVICLSSLHQQVCCSAKKVVAVYNSLHNLALVSNVLHCSVLLHGLNGQLSQ